MRNTCLGLQFDPVWVGFWEMSRNYYTCSYGCLCI